MTCSSQMFWCTGPRTVRSVWTYTSLGDSTDHQRRRRGSYHVLGYDFDETCRCPRFRRRRSKARCLPGLGSRSYQLPALWRTYRGTVCTTLSVHSYLLNVVLDFMALEVSVGNLVIWQEWVFLPPDAMHKRGLCRHAVSVCVFVCLCVCPSRSWIVSKLINISSKFFYHRVELSF